MKNLKEIKNQLRQVSSKTSEILRDSELKSLKGGYKGDPPPYID